MTYYDRKQGVEVEEIEYQKRSLSFLYNTNLGRLLLKVCIARPWFSKFQAKYQNSAISKKDIKPFVEKYQVDIDAKTLKEFNSFNEFFTRSKPRGHAVNNSELISAADSKLSFFPITDDLRLRIKQSNYSIAEILDDQEMAANFAGGTCLIHRLAVSDNHRYIQIDNGRTISHKKINGELHTIRPISSKFNVYARNAREVSFLETEHLGIMAYVEVGALLVGKIKNHNKEFFNRNDEKGYFEFGGSTIIILLNKNIKIDNDIVRMNDMGIETLVEAGERIGLIC
jgi:phosphatidylserine decarboxylase